MTNRKLAKLGKQRPTNQKDPRPPRQTKAQRESAIAEFEAAGFTWTPGPWTYTWPGNFPVFRLAPGILVDDTGPHAGLIARYSPADIEILFPYGTPPTDMAARLNDEILAVMRHDADVDCPSLDWKPVIVNGQEIGPEVGF
jgi:hypothetical protein